MADGDGGGVVTQVRPPARAESSASVPRGSTSTARTRDPAAAPRAPRPAGTTFAPAVAPSVPAPTVFVGPVQRQSLAEAYPALHAVLTEEERVTLGATWDARQDVVAPEGPLPAPPPTALGPHPGVVVPLRYLLEERAGFVDVDVWQPVYEVLLAGGSDELVAELARNEIMRRYLGHLGGVGVSLDSDVTISVLDPEGRAGGPSALEYTVEGTVVENVEGLIGPPELDDVFGGMEDVILAVHADVSKVALAAALVDELEAVTRLVDRLTSQVEGSPEDVVLAEVRGAASRLRMDQGMVTEYLEMPGPELAGASGVETDFDDLATRIADALEVAVAWHEENDLGQSLGQQNAEAEAWYSEVAEENWSEGGFGYVVGGLAYGGEATIMFVDFAESLLSMGFHETANEVARAWQAGEISYDEATDLMWGAAGRAVLVALVTRGVGAATSRLGLGIAARFGLAEASLAGGAVRGGVSGVISGPTGLAAHDLLTRGMAARESSATARAIVETSIPTAEGYLFAAGLGLGLGAAGGTFGTHLANRARLGTVEMLPEGPHRLIAVLADGTEVLEPVVTARPSASWGSGSSGAAAATAEGASVSTPSGLMRVVTVLDDGTEVLEPIGGPIRLTAPPTTPTALVPPGWRPGAGTGTGTSASTALVRTAPPPTTSSVVGEFLRRRQAGATDSGAALARAVGPSGNGPIITPPPPTYLMLPELTDSPLPSGDWVVSLRGGPGLGASVPGEHLPFAGGHAWGYTGGSWDLFRPAHGPTTAPRLEVYRGAGGDVGIVLDIPSEVLSLSTEPLVVRSPAGRGYPMTVAEMTDPATGEVLARSHFDPHARSRPEVVTGTPSTRRRANYGGHDVRYNEWVRRTLEGRLADDTWQAIEVQSVPRTTTGGLPIITEEIIVQLDATTGLPTRAWRLPTTHGFYDTMHDIDAILGSRVPGGQRGAYEIDPADVPRTLRGGRR